MKTALKFALAASLLFAGTCPCRAMMSVGDVSKERAKELGLEIRDGGKFLLGYTALEAKRSGSGSVVVSLLANRAYLEKMSLMVVVGIPMDYCGYEVRMKDFVDREKSPLNSVPMPAAPPRANASDLECFFNGKSPECQFLAGAWEDYAAGLKASADGDTEYKTTVALWFHRLQRGVCENQRAYENLKQELSDTDEHKAIFLQVEKVAWLIEKAFVNRFSKPTRLKSYLKSYKVGPELVSKATVESARTNLTLINARYKVGMADQLDVMEAEQNLHWSEAMFAGDRKAAAIVRRDGAKAKLALMEAKYKAGVIGQQELAAVEKELAEAEASLSTLEAVSPAPATTPEPVSSTVH